MYVIDTNVPVAALRSRNGASFVALNAVAEGFIGDQLQVPPMVSAVKISGVPLYKLARKGLEVERK